MLSKLDQNKDEESNNRKVLFEDAFKGKFYGILKWTQLDDLWLVLKNDDSNSWFFYTVGDEPPTESKSASDLDSEIKKINMSLRREHDEDYCGIVYTDSVTTPSFIKVFDPRNVGTSCSISKSPPLPGWIFSKIPPSNLLKPINKTAKKGRWWGKFLNRL